ncbi:MAG: epoxide hydrolase family protein [Spongiibacteraceae bacterium]
MSVNSGLVERFHVSIPQRVIDDLHQRLRQTRWPDDVANADWSYGFNCAYLQELVRYWLDEYDWRHQEAQINQYPQFKADIDGVPIHFIHVRGKGPNPRPLILTHGYPWTFWDYRKLIEPLTDPAAHGGDAADAFDVVIPSLPGYVFSSPLQTTGIDFTRTADLWVRLMRDVLGYDKFAAHGGDWGAMVTAQLGHKYAEHLLGIHLVTAIPLDVHSNGLPDSSFYGPGEEGWHAYNSEKLAAGSGYMVVQSTRPQTLAYAMHDSPAGLCAWIVEKSRDWSDCGGNVETRFSKDDLLNKVMLYWVSNSFVSAARYYYEAAHRPWAPSHPRQPVVQAPTAILAFMQDVIRMPKRWMEQTYNLQRLNYSESGGHFSPVEEPQRVASDIREFFRSR